MWEFLIELTKAGGATSAILTLTGIGLGTWVKTLYKRVEEIQTKSHEALLLMAKEKAEAAEQHAVVRQNLVEEIAKATERNRRKIEWYAEELANSHSHRIRDAHELVTSAVTAIAENRTAIDGFREDLRDLRRSK